MLQLVVGLGEGFLLVLEIDELFGKSPFLFVFGSYDFLELSKLFLQFMDVIGRGEISRFLDLFQLLMNGLNFFINRGLLTFQMAFALGLAQFFQS